MPKGKLRSTREVLTASAAIPSRSSDSCHPIAVSEKEAALMVGLSARTLQKMRLEGGDGPRFSQVANRRIVYLVKNLEAWLERRSMCSTSEATVRRGHGA